MNFCQRRFCIYSIIITGCLAVSGWFYFMPQEGYTQVNVNQTQVQISTSSDIIYVFDLEKYLKLEDEKNPRPDRSWQYDVVNFVSALQGLVNRDKPQLYIFYVRSGLAAHQMNVDKFWYNHLRGFGGMLSSYQEIELHTLEEVINAFQQGIPYFTGVVTWDPNIPATGNVALSIAGANGLLPVRHDDSPGSLFSQIVSSGLQLPVVDRLKDKFSAAGVIPDTNIPSTGLSKNDAYIWARVNLIETGESSNEYLAAMLDPYDWVSSVPGFQYPNLQNNMIANHDFYISKKAFFFDLDPWWDEVPTDVTFDPFLTGYDKDVLDPIMRSIYDRANPSNKILKVGGFIPWWVKYSKEASKIFGKHDASETVEEFVSILSGYSAILDPVNYPFVEMANASVYQHFPLKDRYFQNSTPPKTPLENKNYLLFVIGDFRSSALMYQIMPSIWLDNARGSFPITWAFNPIVSERVPHIIDWMYETRTPKDYFSGGSTGAGLTFPNRFIPPRNTELDDDLDDWISTSKQMYKKFDLRTTMAADLDRDIENQIVQFTPRLQDSFLEFSPHGVGTVKPFSSSFGGDFVPFFHQSSNNSAFYQPLPSDKIIEEIIKNALPPGQPQFHLYRFKYMSPSSLKIILNRLQSNFPENNWQVLDPFTFFFLLRQRDHRSGSMANSIIPNFLADNLPAEVNNGEQFEAVIQIRNDGWDVWNPPETPEHLRYKLSYYWQFLGDETKILGHYANYLPDNVMTGEVINVPAYFHAPTEFTGIYEIILFIEQENVKQSKITHKVQITVD